jgi:hypothetical protein
MATLTQQKHTKPEQPNASAGASAGPQAQDTLARDHVQARAYEIFQNRHRKGGSGDQMSDWLQAERELSASHALVSTGIESKSQREQKQATTKK